MKFKHVTVCCVLAGFVLNARAEVKLTPRNKQPVGDRLARLALNRVHRMRGEAAIEGDEVIAWNRQVPEPVAVRYGWSDNSLISLAHQAGLPAASFQTDNGK